LAAAVSATEPDLIVPCDDRSAMHLVDLHAHLLHGGQTAAVAMIERSLGRIESSRIAQSRCELIGIARQAGLRAPEMRSVESAAQLQDALSEIGLPAMLKVDGTWGGTGVVAVHTPKQAERARSLLAQRVGPARALKRLVVNRDPYHLRPWLSRATPRVSVQRFIQGRPANSAVACWNGEVLAAIHVEVLAVQPNFGTSSVVRVIEHPDMAKAAATLVRRLGLSGFCGLDFVIEDATGEAHLIEVNARPTPISHLGFGAGRDPVAALVARLDGMPPTALERVTDNPVVALFPQAWLNNPASRALFNAHHDVPWEDPGLVRELLRPPYPARGLSARMLARTRSLPWAKPSAISDIGQS
jgi:ATP-grasp domain-containing protein